jgi:PPM family protein phosphatase
MRLATGRATDQGRTRSNNEDASLVDDEHGLFAVADGMGGHRGGEVASQTAIEGLRAAFAAGAPIDVAITRANDAVLTRAAGNEDLAGMGTTLTAVTPTGDNHLLIGHVGDSRAYLLRHAEPHELIRVTDDHSLVEELVRDGRLTPEQAEAHPQRAIVTRALGVDTDVEVDTYELAVDLGDRVLICSDGLTTMIRDRDVERIARAERDPQRAAQRLVDAANDAGGEDNITVVVVDVVELDPPAVAPGADDELPPAAEPVTAVAPVVPAAPVAPFPVRAKRSRLRAVGRVILVLAPVVIILGVAAAAIGAYARGSYYVGVSRGEVAVFKGVPGGVLGWNPTVDSRTGIKLDELSQLDRDRVRTNSTRGSKSTAQNYVARLRESVVLPSTTTTTVKRPRTTTTRRRRRTTTTRPRTPTTRQRP